MLAHVLEGAVAPVVVKNVRRAWELSRRTISVKIGAAIFAVLRVPLHIPRDEQVQLAIVVVIEKAGGNGPTAACDSRFRGHIGESSVAVVVIQNVLAIASNVQVGIIVIVVVTDGYAHAVVAIAGTRQTGLLGHVREAPVSILTVKAIP